MTRPHVSHVAAKRDEATVMRGRWLHALESTRQAREEGIESSAAVGVTDLLSATAVPQGKPLLALRLVRLTGAVTGWPRHKCVAAIESACAVLNLRDVDVRGLTLGWLLDPRTGGRRLAAWVDQITPDMGAWHGFPYTQYPSDVPLAKVGS